MNIKSPIRLLLHMKSELQLACVRGKFQARKIGAQAGKNCGLNFFLELFAGSGFEGRNVGIAGASNESTFRFRFDAIDVLRNQVLDFHGRIVSRQCALAKILP